MSISEPLSSLTRKRKTLGVRGEVNVAYREKLGRSVSVIIMAVKKLDINIVWLKYEKNGVELISLNAQLVNISQN